MNEAVKNQIQADINDHPIVIFMKGEKDMPQCGFSGAVVQVFNEIGAQFETRNVLNDPDLRQGIKDFSKWPTIPQVYVNGEFIGGCDIVIEMHQKGELAPMVKTTVK